jgi:hypothetical protein
MGLSDLAVFNDYMNETMTELQGQQVGLFNAATKGGITMRSAAMQGDYYDRAHWSKVAGLVRRRNPYGSGVVAAKTLVQAVETEVKIAAGTPPVNIDPGMLKWIQKSPSEAGVVIGRQLAEDSLADMLNTALMSAMAGMGAVAAINFDYSGTGTMNLTALVGGAAKFGDRAGQLACWVMHSKSLFDIYGAAITNSTGLFTFGTIKVLEDGMGRVFVVTDSSSLITGGNRYYAIGLVPGGIDVSQNNDFTANISTVNGDENILSTYQAEWSFNLRLKGFTWDKTNGGHAPTNAALATATNWDQVATSAKDLPGVIVKAQ